ncbi:hypothetical protein [Actinoplanes sp. NPDC051859]
MAQELPHRAAAMVVVDGKSPGVAPRPFTVSALPQIAHKPR